MNIIFSDVGGDYSGMCLKPVFCWQRRVFSTKNSLSNVIGPGLFSKTSVFAQNSIFERSGLGQPVAREAAAEFAGLADVLVLHSDPLCSFKLRCFGILSRKFRCAAFHFVPCIDLHGAAFHFITCFCVPLGSVVGALLSVSCRPAVT